MGSALLVRLGQDNGPAQCSYYLQNSLQTKWSYYFRVVFSRLVSGQLSEKGIILIFSPPPKSDPLNSTELAHRITLYDCVQVRPNELTRCWREI